MKEVIYRIYLKNKSHTLELMFSCMTFIMNTPYKITYSPVVKGAFG